MTDGTPIQADRSPPAHPDVIAAGHLLLMAYKMSGQGLDPPKPADFPPQYDIVKNVIMDDFGTPTFYGFLARLNQAHTNDFVLVIRGTLGIAEWLLDLQSMVPTPFYTYGNVGSGFADTYKTIYLWPQDRTTATMAETASATPAARAAFAAQVASVLQKHVPAPAPSAAAEMQAAVLPAPRLTLAGHSLGSALVTLYAVERLVYRTIPIAKLITFASPLVGDPTFAAAFGSLQIPDTPRIYDNWDPVPKLPPLSGFVPVGTAEEITLSSSYYGWDPLCSHSMDTYLNYFDPSHAAAAACTSLIPLAARRPTAAPHLQAALEMAPELVRAAAPTTVVTRGSTTITITIQTHDG